MTAWMIQPNAAQAQPARVVEALMSSMFTRGGQVCTKAGLVFVPVHGDVDLVDNLVEHVEKLPRFSLLNDGIHRAYVTAASARSNLHGVDVLAGAPHDDSEDDVSAVVLATTTEELLQLANAALLEECFGPLVVLVRYQNVADLSRTLSALKPSLVSAIHAEQADRQAVEALLPGLMANSGRIVWNAATTGLPAGWATHHGGEYPHPRLPGPPALAPRPFGDGCVR